MDEDVVMIRKQHLDSYKQTILETIKNNSEVLLNDILSLLEKPPLDSMDLVRNKLLDCAKKSHLILNAEGLNNILDEYHSNLKSCCEKIQSLRVNTLSSKVNHFKFIDDNDVFVLYKKDFTSLDKSIKKILKDQMIYSYETIIFQKLPFLFQDSVEESVYNKFIEDLSKYMKNQYQKQIINSIDIKILVKDTTLMNVIKEQSDRYLFTINNSRLLNPLE